MKSSSKDSLFDVLTQLLQFVSADNARGTRFVARLNDKDSSLGSMQDRMMIGILHGTIRSDQEASLKFYNSEPTDQRYLTLRSRCIDVVLDELRPIDLTDNQLSDYSYSHIKCLDFYRAGKMLTLYGKHTVARYVLSRGLAIARKYNFTILECMILNEVKKIPLVLSDISTIRQNNSATHKLYMTLYYEYVAEAAYNTVFALGDSFVLRPISIGESMSLNHTTTLEFIDSVNDEYRSQSFRALYLRAAIDYLVVQCDFQSALRKIDDSIRCYLDNPAPDQNNSVGELWLRRLELQIRTRTITVTTDIYNPAEHFQSGVTEWCLGHTLTAFKLLYLGNFNGALSSALVLRKSLSIANVTTSAYEHRMLLEAYLWILTKLLPTSEFGHPDPSSLFSFRESTFLNSMSLLTESKKGTNALVVIAHAFILLIQNKEREAFRRISYLNVYATRYFKGETEQRLWHCVKAMQKIPTFRTRPHMMRDAMAPAIDRIRRLSDLPMKHGFNELVQWDVLLEAYIAWEIERVSRQRQ